MDDQGRPERGRTAIDVEWTMLLHDLRSPLTVAIGRMHLLRRRVQRGETITTLTADLDAIESALVRLNAAVDRLDRSRDQG